MLCSFKLLLSQNRIKYYITEHPIGNEIYYDTIDAGLYKDIEVILESQILKYRMLTNPVLGLWDVWEDNGHLHKRDARALLLDSSLRLYKLKLTIKKWRAFNG